MFHSVSVSGMFKNERFKLEATLIYHEEIPQLHGMYNAYDMTITSRNEEKPVEAIEFSFFLLCNGEIIKPVKLLADEFILTEMYHQRFDNKESLLLLFPPVKEVHIMETHFVFCYRPEETFGIFKLSY